ncbi:MAG: sigma-70 family RNA polymerase sigma factor [Fulvivirga sp.]|uniref:RNA polymerase sigma factor n=1 Tax=Fulvivirga sp. TaxID=1931237 RepID=UPI0032EA954C
MMDSSYSGKDDLSIWRDFVSGDRSALSYIYFKYAKYLLSYGYKICRDKELVEDKVQDLFVQLWVRHDRLGDTDSIKFYLFRSLRRKLAESVKVDKLRYAVGLEMIDQFSGPFENQLIEIETRSERKKLVEQLLAHLNDNQRDILHLKYTVGLSNCEIAEILGMEHQSVKNAVFRSITKIRRFLVEHNISLAYLVKNNM